MNKEKLPVMKSNSKEDVSKLLKLSREQTYFEKHPEVTHKNNCQLYSFGHNEMGQLGQTAEVSKLKYSSVPLSIRQFQNEPISSIGLGDGHTVVVTSDGKVYSWGASACGQLGVEKSKMHFTDTEGFPIEPLPRLVTHLINIKIKTIACGDAHTLALSENGDIYSWGGAGCGQLGHPNLSEMPVDNENFPYLPFPKLIEKISSIKMCDIACGKTHSVSIDNSGTVYTWGAAASGQLGIKNLAFLPLDDEGYPFQPEPYALTELKKDNIYITKAVCGDSHTLLLSTEGEVYSFGSGFKGQLGLGSLSSLQRDKDGYSYMPTPQKIGGLINKRIVYIASGDNHCMVIDEEGRLYGWGVATQGQLGIEISALTSIEIKNHETLQTTPILIPGFTGMKVIAVSCGELHTLVLVEDGIVFGFGMNEYGQLGIEPKKKKGALNFGEITKENFSKEIFKPRLIDSLLKLNVSLITSSSLHNVISINYNKTINEEEFNFFSRKEMCDFSIEYIEIGNELSSYIIETHKFILISNSDYFYKKIIDEGEKSRITIKGTGTYIQFKTIIEYIYLKDLNFITDCTEKDLGEYLNFAKLLGLSKVEAEIKAKVQNQISIYTTRVKETFQIITKNLNQSITKGLFFRPDGSSLLVLNEGLIEQLNQSALVFEEDVQEPKFEMEVEDMEKEPENLEVKDLLEKERITYEDLEKCNLVDPGEKSKIDLDEVNQVLKFFNNKKTSDIQIKFKDKCFFVNKIVLSCNSEFFHSMLTQGMKEENENEIRMDEMEGFEEEEMYLLLLSFYCDKIIFKVNIMLELLKFFDMFQVRSDFKNRKEDQLRSKISLENICKVFLYSDKYNFRSLKSISKFYIRENYDKVIESKGFENLEKEQLLEIIRFCGKK